MEIDWKSMLGAKGCVGQHRVENWPLISW